jgi:RecA-family ATPase
MITYGSSGALIASNGYRITPIAIKSKSPILGNWQQLSDPPDYAQYENCGIGIRCGVGDYPIYGVDCDVLHPAAANYLRNEIGPKPIMRVGKEPKALYVFRGVEEGWHKSSSKSYIEGRVEILGFGQQFVAFGIHPDTGRPYKWPVPSRHPTAVLAKDLPVITLARITEIISNFENYAELCGFTEKSRESKSDLNTRYFEADNPLFEKEPIGIPPVKLQEIVACNDPDTDRQTWINVGFALHHETSGSAEGWSIWDDWSKRGTKYKAGETEYYWDRFGTTSAREPITAAYLLKIYKEKTGNAYSTNEVVVAESAESAVTKDFFADMNWSVNRFIDDVPPRRMIVEGMLVAGITAMVFSAGGVGKSTVLLYLCMRIALACTHTMDFFGRGIQGGSVVILTAEDPDDEINRRYNSLLSYMSVEINESYGVTKELVEKRLHIASTFGIPIQLFMAQTDKGILKRTQYYSSFVKKLKSIENLQLVVVDTKTRYSPAEGAGNVMATQEVTFYEAIARETGASVLLLHHTSKKSRDGSEDGQMAYRDASAVFDSIRAAWYMRPLNKKERSSEGLSEDESRNFFIFENSKNSYIPRHNTLKIERIGFNFKHSELITREGSADEVKDAKRQESLDAVVAYLQEGKSGCAIQADIVKMLRERHKIGRTRALQAISDAQLDGLVDVDGAVGGRALMFTLTDDGKKYQLTLS